MNLSRFIISVSIAMLAISANANPFPTAGSIGAETNLSHYLMGDSGSGAIDDLEDFTEISVAGRRFLSPSISLGLEAGYGSLETKNLGGDVDAYRLGSGARYHVQNLDFYGARPFLGSGINLHHFDSSTFNKDKTEVSVYGEAGLEAMIGDSWMVSTGVRGRVEVGDAYADTVVFAGITRLFGGKSTAKAVPAPVVTQPDPVVVPKVEVEPAPEPEPKPEKIIAQSRVTEKSLPFASGSAAIGAGADTSQLSEFATAVTEQPDLTIIIEGHTDSSGPASFNQRLSLARAEAVEAVLVNEFGVSPDSILTRGFGETKPISSNATKEGRSENRRVEIKLRDDSQS
jgi:OOP family OmpA-OmpF porin